MSRNSSEVPKSPENDPRKAALEGLSDVPLTRPIGVVIIALVLMLEALALVLAGVWFCVGAFTQPQQSVASTVFLIVLVFGLGLALAAVAVNIFRGFRWTRSAAFVWQLLMVAVAVPAFSSGAPLLGAFMLIPAVAAAFFLFTPKVVAFTLRTAAEAPTL